MSDNVKARVQDAEESNTFVEPKERAALVRSQYAIHKYLKAKNTAI